MRQRKRAPRRRMLLVLSAVFALLAVGLATLALSLSQPTVGSVPVSPATPPSTAQYTPSPSPSVTIAPPEPVAKVPARGEPISLTIPSIGFVQTALGNMVAGPSGSVLNPPTFADPAEYWRNFAPYWLSDLGVPGSAATDTVFVMGHACTAGCTDPSWVRFNHLIDLKVGEVVTFTTTAGDIRYAVRTTVSYTNDQLVNDAALARRVWGKHPGELHLISCSESVPGSGNFDQRTVMIATLIP